MCFRSANQRHFAKIFFAEQGLRWKRKGRFATGAPQLGFRSSPIAGLMGLTLSMGHRNHLILSWKTRGSAEIQSHVIHGCELFGLLFRAFFGWGFAFKFTRNSSPLSVIFGKETSGRIDLSAPFVFFIIWLVVWKIFFHILGISSSQVTKSIIFQRVRAQPPTSYVIPCGFYDWIKWFPTTRGKPLGPWGLDHRHVTSGCLRHVERFNEYSTPKQIPSGKHTKSYWKLPFIYSWFTHEKWWFSMFMLVYQRVEQCFQDGPFMLFTK